MLKNVKNLQSLKLPIRSFCVYKIEKLHHALLVSIEIYKLESTVCIFFLKVDQ